MSKHTSIRNQAWGGRPDRRHQMVTGLLAIPVICVLSALARKAWLDFDTAWDSLAYHLPFAALRTGLLSPAQYHLSRWMAACYGGFPVLTDYLQGWLWRLTSHPEAPNFVGLLALLTLSMFLWRACHLPVPDTLVAFLAVPVVLIQSTSAYNDLLPNCAMAAFLACLFTLLACPGLFSWKHAAGACIALAIAMNCKLQFIPVGTLALAAWGLTLYFRRRRLVRMRPRAGSSRIGFRATVATVGALLLVSCYGNAWANFRRFGNPIYPVALHFGPFNLPGQYQQVGVEPIYLAHTLQPVRWALSVMEFDSFDGRRPLWTNGQGDLPMNSRALRMGGYFGVFVLLNLFWLAFLQVRARRRFGWKPAVFFLAITLATAALPASQELRYYLYWMLFLILMNLLLIHRGLQGEERFHARLLFLAGALSCLLFVLSANSAYYLVRNGSTASDVTRGLGVSGQLQSMHLQPGEAVCVIGKNPLTFLYAPIFNSRLAGAIHYGIFEAYSPDDCAGHRIVP